jgi:hypothetical protein
MKIEAVETVVEVDDQSSVVQVNITEQVITISESVSGPQGASGSSDIDAGKTSHGFVVGDVVRHNGSDWVKSQADSAENSEVIGLVSYVVDANIFKVKSEGKITGLSGLIPGTNYFLSASTAGSLTAVEPVTAGQVSKPILIADSSTSGIITNMRGFLIQSPAPAVRECFTAVGNPKTTCGYLSSVVTGTNIVYTCPAGRAALIPNGSQVIYYGTGTTFAFYPELKLAGGQVIKINSSSNVTQGNQSSLNMSYMPQFLAPGESICINASINAQVSVLITVFEFDASDCVFIRQLTYGAGYTTLYTVPAGKFIQPMLTNPNATYQPYFSTFSNAAGPTIYRHIVPPGGTPSNATKNPTGSVSFSNGSALTWNANVVGEGFSYVIESNGAGTPTPFWASFLELNI